MKRTILLSMFPLLFGSVMGQQREAAEKLYLLGLTFCNYTIHSTCTI